MNTTPRYRLFKHNSASISTMSGGWLRVVVMAVFLTLCINTDASAQALRRGRAQQVTGGILIERLDSLEQARADSIANVPDELKRLSE